MTVRSRAEPTNAPAFEVTTLELPIQASNGRSNMTNRVAGSHHQRVTPAPRSAGPMDVAPTEAKSIGTTGHAVVPGSDHGSEPDGAKRDPRRTPAKTTSPTTIANVMKREARLEAS